MSTIITPDKDRELMETVTLIFKMAPQRFSSTRHRYFINSDPKKVAMDYICYWLVSDKFCEDYGFLPGDIRAVDLPVEDPLSRTCILTDRLLPSILGYEDFATLVHIEALARNFKLGINLFTVEEWNAFLDVIRPKVLNCKIFREIDLLYARGVALDTLPARLDMDEYTDKDKLYLIQNIQYDCSLLKIALRMDEKNATENKVDELILAQRIENINRLALAMIGLIELDKLELCDVEDDGNGRSIAK